MRAAIVIAVFLASISAAFAQPGGKPEPPLHNPLAGNDCFQKYLWSKWFQFFNEGKLGRDPPIVDIPKSPLGAEAPVWKQYTFENGIDKWDLLDGTKVERRPDKTVWIKKPGDTGFTKICPPAAGTTPGGPGTTPGGTGKPHGGGTGTGETHVCLTPDQKEDMLIAAQNKKSKLEREQEQLKTENESLEDQIRQIGVQRENYEAQLEEETDATKKAELQQTIKEATRLIEEREHKIKVNNARVEQYDHWIEDADAEIERIKKLPTCPEEKAPGKPLGMALPPTGDVTLTAGLFAAYERLPTFHFIGEENPITFDRRFGIEHLERNTWFTAGSADLSVVLDTGVTDDGSHPTLDAAHLGVIGYSFSTDTRRDEINPFGDSLLLPGTGDAFATYPLGLSLSAGVPLGDPNGENVVRDFMASYHRRSTTVYAKGSRSYFCDDGALTGYAGIGYTTLNQSQYAGGLVPGFLTRFTYDTDVDVHVVRAIAGLRGELMVPSVPGLSYWGNATGLINFPSAHGRDEFELTGLFSDFQFRGLSKSDTTFGYGLGLGIDYRFEGGLKLGLSVNYFRDEVVPVVIRNGLDPSRVEFRSSDTFTFGVTAGFRF